MTGRIGVKNERIEARIEPERAERIRYAAELRDKSMSSFVVEAAAEHADRVIAEHQETIVPREFFDSLLAALDEKESVASLRKAAARALKPR
jgi:uncharacterized protein (DUF1778 family)